MATPAAEMTSPKFPISVEGLGQTFLCDADKPILSSFVLRNKGTIPSGCHGGGCGVCRIQVLQGSYAAQKMCRDRITEDDEAKGIVLACRVTPQTPMRIKVLGVIKKAVTRKYGFV